jgi:hypothetical protein
LPNQAVLFKLALFAFVSTGHLDRIQVNSRSVPLIGGLRIQIGRM